MKKIKTEKRAILVMTLLLATVIVFKPEGAFARIVSGGIPWTHTEYNCEQCDPTPFGPNCYIQPTCQKTDNINVKQIVVGGVKDSNGNYPAGSGTQYAQIAVDPSVGGVQPYDPATCTADPRIKQFCVDVIGCRVDPTCVEKTDPGCVSNPACVTAHASTPACEVDVKCGLATLKIYDKKMEDIVQAEIDSKISDAGLDKSKANTAVESCGGDLTCIDRVLGVLQKDSSYAEGSAPDTSKTDPLTASSLSDLINSNTTTQADEVGALNSADNDQTNLAGKTPGPQVTVTFNTAGALKAGANVSAEAVPNFFSDAADPKKMYYTWFLKRSGCELTDPKNQDKNKKETDTAKIAKCDFDGNERITENDWKIAAAKIIVAKNFDRTGVDYSKFPTGVTSDTSGYVAIPEINKNEGSGAEKKNIGWRNGFLRMDNNNELYADNGVEDDVPNCFVKAPKSGLLYELRKTKSNFDNECPSGYHRACVSDQTAQCNVLNPLFSQADSDAAVPPGSYLIPKTITNAFYACAVSSEKVDGDSVEHHEGVTCSIKDDNALKNFRSSVSCTDDGKLPLCVKNKNAEDNSRQNSEFKNDSQQILGIAVNTEPGNENDSINNDKICDAIAKPDPSNDGLFLPSTDAAPNQVIKKDKEACNVVQDELINGTKDEKGNTIIAGNKVLGPKCTFEKDANLCKHLFPVLPKDITADDGGQAVSGDGEFNIKEKQFWGADPAKSSTTGADKDEERVVGLGVDSFEWMYSDGDQVGVVVEGDAALSSDLVHPGASSGTMWAFSKGACSALDDMENNSTIDKNNPDDNTRGFYFEANNANGIRTAQVDLNACLKDNLLDPVENGADNALGVQLNSMPANPVNDPNGRGDILTVSSAASNAQDSSGLLYAWSVQKSVDGSAAPIDTTNWIDIKASMLSAGSLSDDDLTGLGKKDLKINLNIPDAAIMAGLSPASTYNGVFYLRIKVKITGTATDGSQNAEGFTIVRVKQQQNSMHAYSVIASSTGALSLNKGVTGVSLELCADAQGRPTTPCYVTKNSIIGLEVPNVGTDNLLTSFAWTVNGNSMTCKPSSSLECVVAGNKLFVPIIGNEGEAVDVATTATDAKTKETIQVSRHFIIAKESLQITGTAANSFCGLQCLDQSTLCPKYLGQYTSLMGGAADCSAQVWETRTGNTITLNATGQTGFDWTVDGQIIDEFRDRNQIQILVEKKAGESYNIGLSSHLTVDNKMQLSNVHKALMVNWGVTPAEVPEENGTASIQINVVDGASIASAISTQTGVVASLVTHLPEQLMFLLKISLTAFALLLVTSLLFAVIPENTAREERWS